ncbi:hypothetical protein [Micromonospora aurantiaca (nom. illeg.)]|uniref:hypothetical protein n=1 Tax=Micromonospora aurantiaca (nom. illeg.) TaxID=47850 RepID=UPI003F4A7CAF
MALRGRYIRAYVMHGHLDSAPLDYADFFQWVYDTPPRATQMSITRDLDIAIERMSYRDGFLDLRFVSGNPRAYPLYYNEATGQTERSPVPPGTWAAEPTRVTVVPSERIILIEGRRNGVGVGTLERYFATLARVNEYATRLRLHFSTLSSASFEEELDQLTRIRVAGLEVNRPNTDWDDANDVLSTLAGESDGQSAQVLVSAARGQSLNKFAGIVGLIRVHVRRALTNVRNARVIGRRSGERKETVVSTEKHQLRVHVETDDRATEFEQDEIVFDQAHNLAALATARVNADDELPGEPAIDLEVS